MNVYAYVKVNTEWLNTCSVMCFLLNCQVEVIKVNYVARVKLSIWHSLIQILYKDSYSYLLHLCMCWILELASQDDKFSNEALYVYYFCPKNVKFKCAFITYIHFLCFLKDSWNILFHCMHCSHISHPPQHWFWKIQKILLYFTETTEKNTPRCC